MAEIFYFLVPLQLVRRLKGGFISLRRANSLFIFYYFVAFTRKAFASDIDPDVDFLK